MGVGERQWDWEIGVGDWRKTESEIEGGGERQRRGCGIDIYRVGLGRWTGTVHHATDLSVGKWITRLLPCQV